MHYGYIYEIKNNLNGHTYIGKHKCSAVNDYYMGSGVILHLAYKKYGIWNFTKRIIQYSPTLENLNRSEELWIDFYKGIGKAEYNIADGGDGGDIYNCLSEDKKAEFRRKQSEAWNYDKHFTEEARRHMSDAHKAKKFGPHSEEWNRNIGEGNKGKHRSEETRRKLSERMKGDQRNKGKKRSTETRKKIGAAHKGMHWKLVDGKRVWY